jgi:hypothetical protein
MRLVCTVCKEEKDVSLFTSNKNKPNGKMSYCKDCNNDRNKRYRRDSTNVLRACKRVYGYLQRRVRVKNLKIDFDVEFLVEIYEKQEGLCSYTREKLELSSGSHNTLSVDRKDSSRGYTKDNVCLTTWKVNNCKQDLSYEAFVAICKQVVDNYGTH